jgi:hypothetical protein
MYKLQRRSIQDIRQDAIGQLLFLPDSFDLFFFWNLFIVCVLFSHHHLIRHFSTAFSAHLSSSERHAGNAISRQQQQQQHYILSKSQKTLVLPIREKSARARQKVMSWKKKKRVLFIRSFAWLLAHQPRVDSRRNRRERESLARSASYENRLGTKQMIKKREMREDRRGAKENGRE